MNGLEYKENIFIYLDSSSKHECFIPRVMMRSIRDIFTFLFKSHY